MNADVLRVLDTSAPARQVALDLGMQLADPMDTPPDAPVLAIITDAGHVAALPQLRDRHKLIALVAWNLPEADLLRILDGEIPVFVGEPTPQQLRELAWWGETSVSNEEERKQATALAVLEDVFDS